MIILISTLGLMIIFVLFMIAGRLYKRNQMIAAKTSKIIKSKSRKKRK